MFSSVVESQFLRLKLSPSAIIFNQTEPESPSYDVGEGTGRSGITHDDDGNNGNDCKPIGNRNTGFGSWSFLQTLVSRKDSTGHTEIYVHPLVKSSACNLSEKSLDMCTESLGSETGSEISDFRDDILFLSSETVGCDNTPRRRGNSVTRGMSCSSSFPPPLTSISGSVVSYNPLNTRRMSRGGSFPPPLTSISGSHGVRVTSHREGGRLVLQAVHAPTCRTYMHAERSEGRLRLCLLKEGTTNSPISNDPDGEEVEEEADEVVDNDDDDKEGEVNEEQSEERLILCHSKNTNITTRIFDDEEQDEEDEAVNEETGVVEYELDEEKCHREDEGMNVKSENIGGKIGIKKLAMPMSCKERRRRHKGFLALEPYLVAT